MRILLAGFFVLMLLITPSAAQDFQKGMEAHKDGNYAAALKEFRPLAEQGNDRARVWLGMMYLNGQGVPQDDRKAFELFRSAAENGEPSAQNNLGRMYHLGRGVTKDYAEALRWYRKSVDQGYGLAAQNIGVMYRDGQGVTQDNEQAYMWFDIAVSQGIGRAAKDRDAIARELTADQITRAKQSARNSGLPMIRTSGLPIAIVTIGGGWLFFVGCFGVPLARIFYRAGFSAWWGLLALFGPVIALLIAWTVLAFRDWPMRRAE